MKKVMKNKRNSLTFFRIKMNTVGVAHQGNNEKAYFRFAFVSESEFPFNVENHFYRVERVF